MYTCSSKLQEQEQKKPAYYAADGCATVVGRELVR